MHTLESLMMLPVSENKPSHPLSLAAHPSITGPESVRVP